MALGHLNDFQKFDFVGFLTGKKCEVSAVRSWEEYKDGEKTGKEIGVRIDCVIIEDQTIYNLKPGESFNNKYRQISFKIERITINDCPVKMGDKIGCTPGCFCPNIVKCTPYGSNGFLNNLSIVVDGFEFIKTK